MKRIWKRPARSAPISNTSRAQSASSNPDAEAVRAKSKALALAVSSEKGQFASIIFEKLRAAPGPCTAREIADHAMEDRGMDKGDAELSRLMLGRTCASLRYYRNRRLTQSTFKPGVGLLWEIAAESTA